MSKTLKTTLGISGLIAAALVLYALHAKTEAQELWGHLPLLFYGCLWLGVSAWFLPKTAFSLDDQHWKNLVFSTASGLLLALAFPPLPSSIISFVAWIPLLLVLENLGKQKKIGYWYIYNTVFLWNAVATFWVMNTAFVAGLFATVINAFFMTVPLVLYQLTQRHMPRLGGLAFLVFWLTFEYLHMNWDLSWSWLNLGNAFASTPYFVQWYEFTGVLGGSLWILWVNWFAFRQIKTRGLAGSWLRIVAVILIPIALSLLRYATYVEQGNPTTVALVQPNFEPHYEKFIIDRATQLQRFEDLSRKVVTPETDYLVYPETAIGSVEIGNQERNYGVRAFRKLNAEFPNLQLVSGVSAFRIQDDNELPTDNSRQIKRSGKTVNAIAYNAAIQLSETAEPDFQYYYKSKLVPGAESFPFKQFLGFLKPVVEAAGGTLAGNGKQPQRGVFTSPNGTVAPVICYESVYGEYHRGFIHQGAEAVFVMTNDGWWDNTAGHKQHLDYARLRAIETRRDVARATNTGISCFINQRGDVRNTLPYNTEGAIQDTMLFNQQITTYVRWGDFIGRIAFFTSILIFLNIIVKAILPKK